MQQLLKVRDAATRSDAIITLGGSVPELKNAEAAAANAVASVTKAQEHVRHIELECVQAPMRSAIMAG